MNEDTAALLDPRSRQVVASLEARASRYESWAGASRIVWRRWGEGDPVVLLHGGAGSWTHWIRNIDELAQRGAVWVPDLPGYGDSDALPEPVSFDALAQALEAGARALIPAEVSLDVVGFSLGARVGVLLANRLAVRTRRLVLVGANFVDDSGPDRPGFINWKKVSAPAKRMAALRNNLNLMMLADPASIDDLALHLYATDVGRQRTRPASLLGRSPLRDDLARLAPNVRVSGISGAGEQVFGHVLERQASAVRDVRADGAFYLVPDGGHWVMYEAAESFNRLLLRLLARGNDETPWTIETAAAPAPETDNHGVKHTTPPIATSRGSRRT